MPEAAGASGPEVSILIPYHNRADLTGPCLASLARHAGRVPFEVLLVDDASTEPFDPGAWLPAGTWRALRNETRQSYSRNNNAAAALARGRFLCLLNNDTLVTAGWLDVLHEAACGEASLGVLGNKHLFPDTARLHHAGIDFTDTGEPLHLHPGSDPAAPAVNYPREVPAVTFACALIPTAVYRALGGLDEAYRNGYEDVDFCLRARAAGHRVVYTPASVIYHYGQATPGRTHTDDANRTHFLARWSSACGRGLTERTQADRAWNAACATVPRHRALRRGGIHFAVDMGSPSAFTWATVELVLALRRQGVATSLPPGPLHASIPRDQARLLRALQTRRPFTDRQVKWTHYWPGCLHTPLKGDVNAEFFCTNYRYRDSGRFLDAWMRHVRLNEYRKLPIAGFNRDALLEIGVPETDCAVVPLGYAPEIEVLQPDPAAVPPRAEIGDLHLLLVTNSHDLHRYGTDIAVRALARAFGPADPVVVHIKDYGAGQSTALRDWIAAEPRFPRVEWHNTFLPKLDLMRLYARMDVQFAPFRGEGFAMKILDAMALGVPTLMPLFGGPTEFADAATCWPLPFREAPVGPCYDREQFYLGDGAWWCEPDEEAVAAILAGLPGARDRLARIGAAARAAVRGVFTWDAAARRLHDALDGWGARRALVVGRRQAPDACELSVVIPTRDRPDNLARTLEGYRLQSAPRAAFEIVLVNDHGDRAAVEAAARPFADLSVRVLDNPGPGGPGAARNVGIDVARGRVVLITGDDIVPAPGFLEAHLAGHRRCARLEDALVGLTHWHPDLPRTPFMDHLTGSGAQQFKYDDMTAGGVVSFDRFYTSNCSVKRAFLNEEERLFSDKYRFAAYEDVELGFRLHLRGMSLHFWPTAAGYHHHEMTPASFAQRQYKVGRMLTVLALQRPAFVPNSHAAWLRALEFLRVQPGLRAWLATRALPEGEPLDAWVAYFDAMLAAEGPMSASDAPAIAQADRASWSAWIGEGRWRVWEAANELILRRGMADEWAMEQPDLEAAARAWITLAVLPKTLAGAGVPWEAPFSGPELPAGWVRHFPLMGRITNAALRRPLIGALWRRCAGTRPARWLVGWLHRRGSG